MRFGGVVRGSTQRVLRGRLPDWIIVGAMKAGTTTLHDALHRSRQAVHPAGRDVHLFSVHWDQGVRYYRQQFRRIPFMSTGEKTPYYLFHPHAAERLASVMPDARVIALLRDPVERAYSHWGHQVQQGREPLEFPDGIAAEPSRLRDADPDDPQSPYRHFSYVSRGFYADQIERLYRWFSPDQVLVLCSEDMFADPSSVVCETCRWLGIRSPATEVIRRNAGAGRASMDEGIRQHLEAVFEEPNRRLAELVGRDFAGWASRSS